MVKKQHLRFEDGQTVVEYALVVGLVSVVIVVTLATVGAAWLTALTNLVTSGI